MVPRMLAIHCIALVLCIGVVSAQSTARLQGGGTMMPPLSDVHKMCSNLSVVMSKLSGFTDCAKFFDPLLVSSNNDSIQCGAVHQGLMCVAKHLVKDDYEECARALLRIMIGSPGLLKQVVGSLGLDSSMVTLNVTNCMKMMVPPDSDKNEHQICSNISMALPKLSNFTDCKAAFGPLMVSSNNDSVQCRAWHQGLMCVANHLVKDDHELCARAMMRSIMGSPGLLKEVIQGLGLDASKLTLNVTNCLNLSPPVDDDDDDDKDGGQNGAVADAICSDVPTVISKAILYADCLGKFTLVLQSSNPTEQCTALVNGLKCLAENLVEEEGVMACLDTMMRILTESPNMLQNAISQFGIDASLLTLDASKCSDFMKPETNGTSDCPSGNVVNCFDNPCRAKMCPAHPRAKCRANYCGGCNHHFFLDEVNVTDECKCPKERLVQCFVDPCEVATCPEHPNAVCRPNYCGGCKHKFFLNGNDVTGNCSGKRCPSAGMNHTCNGKTTCLQAHQCRYLKEADCKIDRCTCQETYVYSDKRVNCSQVHTECQKRKMKAEMEEKQKQEAGTADASGPARVIKCTNKGAFEKECEGDQCTCLNAKTGEKAVTRKGDQNLDCSDVQRQTAVEKVKGKLNLSKNKRVEDLTPQAQMELKTKTRNAVLRMLDNKIEIQNDRLVSASISYEYEAVATTESDLDVFALVNALNEDIDQGLFPDVLVGGETFVASDGTVVETFTEEPGVAPEDDDDDNKTKIIVIVVVVVVVAVLLVAMAVGCYMYRKSDNRSKSHEFSDIQGHSNLGYKMQP